MHTVPRLGSAFAPALCWQPVWNNLLGSSSLLQGAVTMDTQKSWDVMSSSLGVGVVFEGPDTEYARDPSLPRLKLKFSTLQCPLAVQQPQCLRNMLTISK